MKNLYSSKDWPHRLKGHAFKQTPGDSEGQRSLVCCNPWDCKEVGHNLPTELTTKMKNLHSSKDTTNKMKRQATDYEETFTICLTKDCTRTYTELPKLTKKKDNNEWARALHRHF